MFSAKIPSKLNTSEGTEVFDLRGSLESVRDDALEFLAKNYLDHEACARHLGLDLSAYFELRELFRKEFELAERAFLLKLEAFVLKAALGQADVEAKVLSSALATAKWVLERRSGSWNKTQRVQVQHSVGDGHEVSGRAAKLLEDYERRALRIGDNGSGGGEGIYRSETDSGAD